MLKLKLQYFGHLMWSWLIGKDSDAGRDWGQEKGMTEDEMAEWHHWLDGRESEWTLGDGDGQGGLVCCDSWGLKESDATERLNWTEKEEERGMERGGGEKKKTEGDGEGGMEQSKYWEGGSEGRREKERFRKKEAQQANSPFLYPWWKVEEWQSKGRLPPPEYQ